MDLPSELRELARNLWWTWHPGVISLFRDIDPTLWRKVNHNPIAFLAELPPGRLEERAADLASESRISYAVHRLREYVDGGLPQSTLAASPLGATPVAYFSAEFGLHESLPIYSGGLGILAGDVLKSASDLAIPMVGVGLFYAQGYFNQRLDASGRQDESYFETPLEHLPLVRVTNADGTPMLVEVATRAGTISIGLWLALVGRSKLLLLDTDVPENAPADRELTGRLYGGDTNIRIRQELVLGVGGVRALASLGIRPGVIHLNEGHSAFAVLELARREMDGDGIDFTEALRRVRSRTVFTTHTPVEAGHDRFTPEQIEQALGPLRDKLGISPAELMALGRVAPAAETETFCMTVIGLKSSWKANGVSAIHGKVTRHMWHPLWLDRAEPEVPISHVTNGVHVSSWLAPPMRELFDSALGTDWERRMCLPETWAPFAGIKDEELWEAHQIAKARLVGYVQRQVCSQEARRDGKQEICDLARKRLDPHILTIGVARRFATYKRADLILSNDGRLDRLLSHPERPIQIVFSGKAHPRDEPGKQLIQRIYRLSLDPRFKGRIVFIEDYDINVARHLLQGVDVWLNVPRRPLEACGTSGMKALFNGVLNCSALDGWWAGAYNGSNGFAVGAGGQHADTATQDRRDAAALYDVLEGEVLPLYYGRDERGIPRGWVARMKNAILSLAWRFNADRMLMAYAGEYYLPTVGGGLVPRDATRFTCT